MLNNDNYLIEAIEADRVQDESADQIMSYLTIYYKSADRFLMSDRTCDRIMEIEMHLLEQKEA